MGKGDRRGKAKKKFEFTELAEAPRKKARGRKRMEQIQREKVDRNPGKVALQVRARQMGQDDWRQMQAQALGEPAGRAIYLSHKPDDAAKLWSVYAGLTASEARYHRIVLGKSMAAKTAKIEFLPDRFEARADDQPDLRSEDERHRDATNAWDSWLNMLNLLSLGDRAVIESVSRGWVEPVKDGEVTIRGRQFVVAIEKLQAVVD
ncbi:hypothetical protein [Ruegeria jejuensis]|uniref:hypothetical protein n=1 Tax=Ruegeria jejuensis TaxID=3233338 RepID=UPI00355ADDA0